MLAKRLNWRRCAVRSHADGRERVHLRGAVSAAGEPGVGGGCAGDAARGGDVAGGGGGRGNAIVAGAGRLLRRRGCPVVAQAFSHDRKVFDSQVHALLIQCRHGRYFH